MEDEGAKCMPGSGYHNSLVMATAGDPSTGDRGESHEDEYTSQARLAKFSELRERLSSPTGSAGSMASSGQFDDVDQDSISCERMEKYEHPLSDTNTHSLQEICIPLPDSSQEMLARYASHDSLHDLAIALPDSAHSSTSSHNKDSKKVAGLERRASSSTDAKGDQKETLECRKPSLSKISAITVTNITPSSTSNNVTANSNSSSVSSSGAHTHAHSCVSDSTSSIGSYNSSFLESRDTSQLKSAEKSSTVGQHVSQTRSSIEKIKGKQKQGTYTYDGMSSRHSAYVQKQLDEDFKALLGDGCPRDQRSTTPGDSFFRSNNLSEENVKKYRDKSSYYKGSSFAPSHISSSSYDRLEEEQRILNTLSKTDLVKEVLAREAKESREKYGLKTTGHPSVIQTEDGARERDVRSTSITSDYSGIEENLRGRHTRGASAGPGYSYSDNESRDRYARGRSVGTSSSYAGSEVRGHDHLNYPSYRHSKDQRLQSWQEEPISTPYTVTYDSSSPSDIESRYYVRSPSEASDIYSEPGSIGGHPYRVREQEGWSQPRSHTYSERERSEDGDRHYTNRGRRRADYNYGSIDEALSMLDGPVRGFIKDLLDKRDWDSMWDRHGSILKDDAFSRSFFSRAWPPEKGDVGSDRFRRRSARVRQTRTEIQPGTGDTPTHISQVSREEKVTDELEHDFPREDLSNPPSYESARRNSRHYTRGGDEGARSGSVPRSTPDTRSGSVPRTTSDFRSGSVPRSMSASREQKDPGSRTFSQNDRIQFATEQQGRGTQDTRARQKNSEQRGTGCPDPLLFEDFDNLIQHFMDMKAKSGNSDGRSKNLK